MKGHYALFFCGQRRVCQYCSSCHALHSYVAVGAPPPTHLLFGALLLSMEQLYLPAERLEHTRGSRTSWCHSARCSEALTSAAAVDRIGARSCVPVVDGSGRGFNVKAPLDGFSLCQCKARRLRCFAAEAVCRSAVAAAHAHDTPNFRSRACCSRGTDTRCKRALTVSSSNCVCMVADSSTGFVAISSSHLSITILAHCYPPYPYTQGRDTLVERDVLLHRQAGLLPQERQHYTWG